MKISTGRYELDLITATITTRDKTKQARVVDGITVEMMSQRNAQRAWQAIKDLAYDGELIDHIGVSERMGESDDFMWLAEVISESCALPVNITGYAKRVRQAAYLTDARDRALAAVTAIDDLSDITQVSTVAGSIEAIFEGLLLETNDKRPQLFKDVAKDYIGKLHDKVNGKEDEHIVLTNIPDLDSQTGGFNRSDLIVIGGLSGSGKTELAVKVIGGIVKKENRGALMFSMEMSNSQVVERSISGEAGLPVSSLRNPERLEDFGGWDKVGAGTAQLINCKFYMTDQTNMGVNDICNTARRHKADNPDLDVIIVDHVGLMDLEQSAQGRHDLQVGEVSKKLKSLAKEIEVPVILLTQLTGKKVMDRPVTDREPRAQDIKDSSRIEEDADLILLCHRQLTHDENAPDIAQVILAKARHAIMGTNVYFRFVHGHFIATAQDVAANDIKQYKSKSNPVLNKPAKLK